MSSLTKSSQGIPNKPGVYRLDFPNGYFYIGQAVSLRRRWQKHQYFFRSGRMSSGQPKLFNVWTKYGEPTFSVLMICEKDQLDVIEQFYLSSHWGDRLMCNTHPSSVTPKGAKRSTPTWSKGKTMSADDRALLSTKLKGLQAGERHSKVKLTEVQVLEIRSKYVRKVYTAVMLSKEYGVTKHCIADIVTNRNWTHLPLYDK